MLGLDLSLTPQNPDSLFGIHRDMVPPDPISNSEVKRVIADGSVGLPHVRVGQCQTPHLKPSPDSGGGFSISSA